MKDFKFAHMLKLFSNELHTDGSTENDCGWQTRADDTIKSHIVVEFASGKDINNDIISAKDSAHDNLWSLVQASV